MTWQRAKHIGLSANALFSIIVDSLHDCYQAWRVPTAGGDVKPRRTATRPGLGPTPNTATPAA